MAVDKSNGIHRGRIYVCLPVKENGNGKAIIQVSFSDDQGATWSNLRTVSIPLGRQNWFPWIAVDDITGEILVAYYSLDTPTGFTTNTYVAHSSDGGCSWENLRVSDVSHITATIPGPFSAGYAGDYISIAAHNGKAYPIWMDDRNGTWQIYCSPITYSPNPTISYTVVGSSTLCVSQQYTVSPVPPVGTTVTWSSSNTAIATVSPTTGSTTTATKAGVGTCTITANIAGGCTAQPATITITTLNIPTLTITGPSLICGTLQQTYTITPAPVNATINWVSSNPAIATISSSGVVQPVANGTCTITANVSYANCIGNLQIGKSIDVVASSTTTIVDDGIQPFPICIGNVFGAKVATVPTATSYNWTATPNFTILSGQGTPNITLSSSAYGNGTVNVNIPNSCNVVTASRDYYTGARFFKFSHIARNYTNNCFTGLATYFIQAASFPNATSYKWKITYVTVGQVLNVVNITTAAPTVSHNYGLSARSSDVEVYAETNCGNTNTLTYADPTIILCTDGKASEIEIYPNPTNGLFNVSLLSNNSEASIQEIIIKDKMGTVVYRQKFTNNQKTQLINLSAKQTDIYMVQIFDGTVWQTQKLSLQR